MTITYDCTEDTGREVGLSSAAGALRAARALRGEGFATVPALSAADTPERLRCTHVLRDGRAAPLPPAGR